MWRALQHKPCPVLCVLTFGSLCVCSPPRTSSCTHLFSVYSSPSFSSAVPSASQAVVHTSPHCTSITKLAYGGSDILLGGALEVLQCIHLYLAVCPFTPCTGWHTYVRHGYCRQPTASQVHSPSPSGVQMLGPCAVAVMKC